MVSSLTGQFQSHSASPIEDGSSHLSKAIWASHVKISPFVAWESRDERLPRPFTWVCFLLCDDYDITHHMCYLPTPADHAGRPSGLYNSFLILGLFVSTWFSPPQQRSQSERFLNTYGDIYTGNFNKGFQSCCRATWSHKAFCSCNKLVLNMPFYFFLPLNVVPCRRNTLKTEDAPTPPLARAPWPHSLLMGNLSPNT